MGFLVSLYPIMRHCPAPIRSGRPRWPSCPSGRFRFRRILLLGVAAWSVTPARASIFQGETLDLVADILTWVVLIVAPVVGIAVFWIVHIFPEKIAERKRHPQAKAIQCLCLLSLAFGGLLWPLAWLWAYSKPVLHKLAYGTDQEDHHEANATAGAPAAADAEELRKLRERIKQLEGRLAAEPERKGGA